MGGREIFAAITDASSVMKMIGKTDFDILSISSLRLF